MHVMHVYVHVKPDDVEAFKVATLENASESMKEKGITQFDVLQQDDDSTRFVLVEAYRTPDAPDAHRQTVHYKKWREIVEPMMVEPRRGVIVSRSPENETGK